MPETVRKIAAWVTVTDELMEDRRDRGPRWRTIPERGRWAQLWRESQPFAYYNVFADMAPPWERWDPPAAPAEWTLLPRLEALGRTVAHIREGKREARRRLADCWLALKGQLPDEDYD